MSLAFQERFKNRISAVGKQGELEVRQTVPVPKEISKQPILSAQLSSELAFAKPISLHSPVPSFSSFQPDRLPPASKASGSVPSRETQSTIDFKAPRAERLAGPSAFTHRQSLDHPAKQIPSPGRSETQKRPLIPQPAIERPALPISKSQTLPPTISAPETRSEPRYSPYTLKDYRLIRPSKYLQLGGLGSFMIGTPEWMKKKELDDKRRSYGEQVLAANSSRLSLSSSVHHSDRPEGSFSSNSRQRGLEFARGVHPPSPKFTRVAVFLDHRL